MRGCRGVTQNEEQRPSDLATGRREQRLYLRLQEAGGANTSEVYLGHIRVDSLQILFAAVKSDAN